MVTLPMRDEAGRFCKKRFGFKVSEVARILSEYVSDDGVLISREAARRDLRKLGFKKMGQGYYKAVFIHDRWVVKARTNWLDDRLITDWNCLREARKVWGFKKHLPKTYALGPFQIQERFDPNRKKFDRHYTDIILAAMDLSIGDVHEENIGWRGDRFVFIDLDTEARC